MISIRNIKTIIMITISIAALTSCNACKDSLDMTGPDNCAENPSSEACQTLCQNSAEYQTWCNITEFCARVSDNAECAKKCAEDPTLAWCGVNPPPPTSSCPTDGSFKYTTIAGVERAAPVAMKTLEDKLIKHEGGTVNAVAALDDLAVWSIGSKLYSRKFIFKEAYSKELNGVIRDLALVKTITGKTYVIAATDYGPKIVEIINDFDLGPVHAFPQFGETIAVGTSTIDEFRPGVPSVSAKTAEGLSVSLNATGSGVGNEAAAAATPIDYAVFATKYQGVWGIDLSMIKGGCAEYVGTTPDKLADIEMASKKLITLIGAGQASTKIEEYDLSNMASGVKKSKIINDLRAINITGDTLYGALGTSKIISKVSYSAFDTQNWLKNNDLSEEYAKTTNRIAITKDEILVATPLSPTCGLTRIGNADFCAKNEPAPMEIDTVRDKLIMGLSPLDRNYMAFVAEPSFQVSFLENISASLENNLVKSISSHFDYVYSDIFISASTLHTVAEDSYLVSISPRTDHGIEDWKAVDLKQTFPGNSYSERWLADMLISQDRTKMYLLMAANKGNNSIAFLPSRYDIDDKYKINEVSFASFSPIVSQKTTAQTRILTRAIKSEKNTDECQYEMYNSLVLANGKIYTMQSITKVAGLMFCSPISTRLLDEIQMQGVDAIALNNDLFLLQSDKILKINNPTKAPKNITQTVSLPANDPKRIYLSSHTGLITYEKETGSSLYLINNIQDLSFSDQPYLKTFDDAYVDDTHVIAVSRDNGVEVYDLTK